MSMTPNSIDIIHRVRRWAMWREERRAKKEGNHGMNWNQCRVSVLRSLWRWRMKRDGAASDSDRVEMIPTKRIIRNWNPKANIAGNRMDRYLWIYDVFVLSVFPLIFVERFYGE